MAKLKYTLTFGPRPGGSPNVNHWTYHHVLPWRYYYLAGNVLTMMARYRLATTDFIRSINTKHLLRPAMEADRDVLLDKKTKSQDPKKLKAFFGADHSGFDIGVSHTPLVILKTLNKFHEPAGVLTALATEGSLDPDTSSRLASNPCFGGFEGMNPGQRTDDPHDGCENRRPHNSSQAWWGLLNILGQSLKGFAPELGSLPDNRTLTVRVASENAWKVFYPTIEKLVASHNAVYRFKAVDWDYHVNGSKKPWNSQHRLNGRKYGSIVGPVFKLNKDGKGDTLIEKALVKTLVKTPVDMIRAKNHPRDQFHFLV